MKILVIGTGSIGKRHIENLVLLGADVFAYSYRGDAVMQPGYNGRVQFVSSWHESLKQVDGVVIANNTAQHLETALLCAESSVPFYIEKPLSHKIQSVDVLLDTVLQKSLVVEAGFMMRFHPNLRWLRDQLHFGTWGEPLYLRAAVGQWLPDWRPGTDYRNGYGAFRSSGGGVIFDLIHELDIVHWMLGAVSDVSAMVAHDQRLQIETEAIAQIGLKMHSGVLAQVHLDYVRSVYGRGLELVCEQGVLFWHYGHGSVTLECAGKEPTVVHRTPNSFQRNDMFLQHMEHFLMRVSNSDILPASSLIEAVHVLRVALAAHQSAKEHRQLKL